MATATGGDPASDSPTIAVESVTSDTASPRNFPSRDALASPEEAEAR